MAPDPRSIRRVHTPRRPAYSRAALMLVALLSVVLLGSVQGTSCRMHGLDAAQAATAADDPMAGHAGMAGMSHHEGTTSEPGGHHGCCTCIGDCTMVAPLASAPSAAIVLVALVVPAPSRPVDAEPPRAPGIEPDRLLPFANGPPPSTPA